MQIRDGGWVLFSEDRALGRQTWEYDHGNGFSTYKTVYDVTATIDTNQVQRNLAENNWKGDYHHIASISPNVFHEQLAEANKQKDDKFISKWLNDSDNRAWRTKDGQV